MIESIVNAVKRRNPFYIASVLCMLIGLYALAQQLGLHPGQWRPLLVLMGVLQLYEVLLLALAWYLLRD